LHVHGQTVYLRWHARPSETKTHSYGHKQATLKKRAIFVISEDDNERMSLAYTADFAENK